MPPEMTTDIGSDCALGPRLVFLAGVELIHLVPIGLPGGRSDAHIGPMVLDRIGLVLAGRDIDDHDRGFPDGQGRGGKKRHWLTMCAHDVGERVRDLVQCAANDFSIVRYTDQQSPTIRIRKSGYGRSQLVMFTRQLAFEFKRLRLSALDEVFKILLALLDFHSRIGRNSKTVKGWSAS